jgi:hypothetical protein
MSVRRPHNAGVAGSSPSISTIKSITYLRPDTESSRLTLVMLGPDQHASTGTAGFRLEADRRTSALRDGEGQLLAGRPAQHPPSMATDNCNSVSAAIRLSKEASGAGP